MIKIGILGDIGSGKSYVAQCFGYPVFDADKEVIKLYKNDLKVFRKLKKSLPKFIYSFPINKSEITKAILFNNRALNIIELAGLIKKADFIIANDTGPAHMSAHLNKSGVVLFGEHTTPDKVSIETEKFVAIKSKNLKELSSKQVFSEIFEKLKIIFN